MEVVTTPSLEQKVSGWKRSLLDLTRRNQLLYFKPRRTSTIPFIEPDSLSLFKALAYEGKTFGFYLKPEELTFAASEEADDLGLDADLQEEGAHLESRDEATVPVHPPRPDEIVTGLEAKDLQNRLKRLRLRSRSAVSEQGVNILFVAFGFLHWRERNSGSPLECSPLLLVPVELQRDSSLDPFRLVPIEDECVLNPTLVEKLSRDFGLVLNSDSEQGNDPELETLIARIENRINHFPDWFVSREVHLGLFSFTKLLMYKDLDRHYEKIAAHPLLSALAGDSSRLLPPSSDLPTFDQLDDLVSPQETFQVLDADSSQIEAIEAAKRGVSFVLQGPPGTGKSQTITNIIAEAICAGKRVLFVSVKMAALDVVKSRLDKTGLGTFCLELHSHRANKREVLGELGKALDFSPSRALTASDQDLRRLQLRRRHLNHYVRALHEKRSALNLSAHDVMGKLMMLNQAPDLRFKVQGAMTLESEELERIREAIQDLTEYGDIVLNETVHPWYQTRLTQFSYGIKDDIFAHFMEAIDLLRHAKCRGAAVADVLGLAQPVAVSELEILRELVAVARQTPKPPSSWFEPGRLTAAIRVARLHHASARAYSERRTAIETKYWPNIFFADVISIRDRVQQGEAVVEPLSAGNESSIDLVFRKHSWLAETLDTLTVDLQRVQRLRAEAATLLDCPVPLTLEEVAKHSWILGVVASDPRPTADWFDPQRLEQIRELVDHAATLAENIRAGELALAAHSAEIYTFVTEDVARAYAEDYNSSFGRMSFTYWRRQGKLRATLREPAQLNYEDAAGVVAVAHRVNVARNWFAEQSHKLSEDLGAYYTGEDSDWPAVLSAIDHTRRLVEFFGTTGVPTGVRNVLISRGDRIRLASDLHRQLSELVARIDQTLASLTSVADITQIIADHRHPRYIPVRELVEQVASWHAQLQGLWSAGDSFASLRRDSTVPQVAQILGDIDEILSLRAIEEQLGEDSSSLHEQFGELFAGMATDWDQILAALAWTGSVLDLFPSGPPPDSFIHRICAGSQMPLPTEQDEKDLTTSLEHWRNELNFLDQIFPPEALRIAEMPLAEAPISAVIEGFEFRLDRLHELPNWIGSRRAVQACERLGLGVFIAAVRAASPVPQTWIHAFDKRFYLSWLDEVERAEPLLAEFRGTQHQRIIEEFCTLDRRQFELASKRIQARVDGKRPKRANLDRSFTRSEPAVLLRELRKRARHKPLRRLFKEIPNVLLALKPCLLMSPLSVSQYLDADAIRFDLVIFDEASQIKPEDAVGSIMRGTQTIVVGDPQQLPPSDFFAITSDEKDDDGDDDEDSLVYESILDECLTVNLDRKMLRWHYRSRDEDLIAFSNYHFYEGRLVTFPSADSSSARGISFEHVPGGKYERRGTRVNTLEARRVAERTMEHARDYVRQKHKRSLGVVAFSQAQQIRILDEIEILRHANPELEPFFAETRDDAFFVKNLENVQGDERDVIFISVGYADSEGRDVPIPLNFGPLNRAGGERRLNVLVTRAREQIRVISSIYPHQIDASRSSSVGVKRLHDYLKYAVEGSESLRSEIQVVDGWYESPFEEAVGEALKRRGIKIRRQIGCSGYRIDLGVEDPEKPGRFLLGIECDGATYHSYKTARDRDRLRQQVLEGLGWRIHRIWSADWFRDPEGELRRVLDAIETARHGRPSEPAERLIDIHLPDPARSSPQPAAPSRSQVPSRPQSNSVRPQPYNEANLPRFGGRDAIFEVSDEAVIVVLVACVAQEGPIHSDRALARVARCWGYERMSSNVEERVRRALRVAVQKRRIIARGSFLWDLTTSTDPYQGPIREVKPRSIEQVAIEELAGTVLLVLQQGFAMPLENLITETAQFLGLSRTGHIVVARIREAIQYLHEKGRVSIAACGIWAV